MICQQIIILFIDIITYMVDYTVTYSPNSFGESNAHDTRYNLADPFAPAFDFKHNFVLLDTPALNDSDGDKIMNRMIDIEVNKPENLLNDPILNRARANDPTVSIAIKNDPIVFPRKRDLLIDQGNHDIYGNTYNDPIQYEHFIDGTIDKQLYKEFLERNFDNPNFKTTGLLTSDKFWLDDPMVLFRSDNYYKIVPSENMSKIEILNALTRFFIYVSILYILFSDNIEYIYIPLVGIIIILFLYFIQQNDPLDNKREQFCRQDRCNKIDICQKPNRDNPFMNVTMADWMDNRERPPGCIATDRSIRQSIDENFNYNLFKNVEDLFDRGYSQRQFYTTPSTTIPNDQTGFANWLYKLPETCKENQSNCLKYEDIRYNRFNPNTDRMERIREDII